MTTGQIIWLIVAVLVILGLIFVAMTLSKRRQAQQIEADRIRANELRSESQSQHQDVRNSELQAREAQLDADRRKLEAEQAQAQADEVARGHHMDEASYEDRLREADRIDPDVDQQAADYEPNAHVAEVAPNDTGVETGPSTPDSGSTTTE